MDRALHRELDLVDLERLRDVVEGALAHGLDGGLHGAEARDEDHLGGGRDLADLAQEIEARLAPHADVPDDEVEVALGAHLLDRRLARVGGLGAIALLGEDLLEESARDAVVIDDEDARRPLHLPERPPDPASYRNQRALFRAFFAPETRRRTRHRARLAELSGGLGFPIRGPGPRASKQRGDKIPHPSRHFPKPAATFLCRSVNAIAIAPDAALAAEQETKESREPPILGESCGPLVAVRWSMQKSATAPVRAIAPLVSPLILAIAGCGGGGGGGSSSSGFASTAAGTTGQTAPGSTGSGSSGSSATPAGPIDYTGTWELTGTDAKRGAYTGTATVAAISSGFSVQRLVTYSTQTASGRSVISAWNATGAIEPGGLHLYETLRQANVVKRAGTQLRLQNDETPLAVDAVLGPASGGTVTSTASTVPFKVSFATAGLSETWVHSGSGAPPLFPATDFTLEPLHPPPTAGEHNLLFNFFAKYQTLNYVAPYATRADFQGGVHQIPIDHSCRDYYRTNGPGSVVVLDGVVDDISVLEETWRADAFGHLLHEKAEGFDTDMETNHLDPTGMIGDLNGPAPYVFAPSGDGALHLGCWVASQVYRYQVTGDAQALANVEKGLGACLMLVDISPDKTQFARAVQTTATAPSGWNMGTGPYAGIAWLPGGNNDMLHGIEYAFLLAEQVLPAGHPLRAQLATQSLSLVNNVSIAQSGSHQFILLEVAARTSNDPTVQARYASALQGDLQDQVWFAAGNGIFDVQGIADWSGHHLGAVTFCALRVLGGISPSSDEQNWRNIAQKGANAAFAVIRPAREGLLDAIASAEGVAGSGDDTKDILAEIPFPKPTGDADIERDVSDTYSVSPYPSDPWKNDWMSNPGRVQALTGVPMFYRGGDENYWARGCLLTGGTVNAQIPTSQDYLHVYWLGRLSGAIAPLD